VNIVWTSLISGLLLGCAYAGAAVGLSLAMGMARVFNLAHTAFGLACGYLAYFLLTTRGIDPLVAAGLLAPLMFLAGLALWPTLFRPTVRGVADPALSTSILTLGLAIVIENLLSKVWTPNPRVISTAYSNQAVNLLGLTAPASVVIAAGLGLALVLGIYWFLNRTFLGLAVQAVAQNPDGARLVGIRAELMSMLVFALSVGTAAVGGVGLAMVYSFGPASYFDWLLTVLLIVVVGGAGAILGTLAAALTVGIVLGLGGALLPQAWNSLILFGMLLIILLLRPYGLFR
jgi:branched-chain amino acid transport system permease protein